MKPPDPDQSPNNTPEPARLSALIQQFQASCSRKPKGLWIAYVAAGCYGLIAAIDGLKFFGFYCGILVVVLILHGFAEHRSNTQMGLLLELARELEEKKAT
jgi:hypothetical protein